MTDTASDNASKQAQRPSSPLRHPLEFGRWLFYRGHNRSVKAKKNIAGLFVLRGVNSLVSLMLVPLTLAYLDKERFGIWVTLTSVIGWAGFLDIGLGNGLRNKLAESIAKEDEQIARIYVSTTYTFIAIIAVAVIVVFSMINPLLSWSAILNTPPTMEAELHILALVVLTGFCLKLLFGLINTVLVAHQRPAAAGAIDALVGMVSLVAVWILTKTVDGSLFWLGVAITAPMVIVPLIANIWFFSNRYRRISPNVRQVQRGHMRDLVDLGVRFFILQLSGIVVFSTASLLIAQIFGPGDVTPFNIAFKYYGVAATGFTIVLTPFWSAYTDAYVTGDLKWISRSFQRLKILWVGLVVAVIIMTAFADLFYPILIRGKADVHIPFLLSAFTGVYVLVLMWCTMYVNFINGVGKIRLQLWGAIITALMVIPLEVVFAKACGLGTAGVSLGMALSLLPWCFVWPLQVRKILRGTAHGIWNK